MFTNGLATIMTDELHAYEEGINTNSEAMYLNYGNPKVVERLMTTVAAYDRIITVNAAGHLHFNTNWYSGSDSYREGPFEWGKYYSYLVLHPGILMAEYNSDPTGHKYVIGAADGILAHGKHDKDGHWAFPDEINWRTDATRGNLPAGTTPMQIFWAAYRWTGDAKYLLPINASVEQANTADSFSVGGARVLAEKDNIKPLNALNEDVVSVLGKQADWGAMAQRKAAQGGGNFERYVAWEMSGDIKHLEELYGAELKAQANTMYTQTEGHWWSDRVEIDSQYLQRTRLGGIALVRGNITPGATLSWDFAQAEDAVKLALLVPTPKRDHVRVVAFNTADHPVAVKMTGWNVAAGTWTLREGEADARGALPVNALAKLVTFEKSAAIPLTIPPGKAYAFELMLKTPSDAPETRPDIGIGADDVELKGNVLRVAVHSLGAKPTPAGRLELVDVTGKTVASVTIPPLAAPTDLKPHTWTGRLTLPHAADFKSCHVHISLDQEREITTLNNDVLLGK
jgi:hypothetical protein